MRISIKYIVSSILGIMVLYHIPNTIYQIPAAYAADSTPSASIKSKVDALKAEIASKAAKLKQEINSRLQNKAYVGVIKQKSDNTLTLASSSGPKIVKTTQDTNYQVTKKSKSKTTFATLSEEDYIAALGDVDETGVLTARKIIVLPTTNNQKPKTYLWGQIISVSDNLLNLRDKDAKSVAVSITSQTDTQGNYKKNDFVIVSGLMSQNEILEAKFIYVIPQGGFIKTKQLATPSAQPATKSASQSGKKK